MMVKNNRLLIAAGLAVFTVVICGFLETSAQVPDPGWTPDGTPQMYEKGHLYDFIDGGAELFEEFGVMRLTVQTYRNGDAEADLAVYQMDSPNLLSASTSCRRAKSAQMTLSKHATRGLHHR